VINVILPLECRDIGSSKCTPTLMAEQAESAEVIRLAEGILASTVLIVRGEKLGGNYLATVLQDISMMRKVEPQNRGSKLTLHLKQSR
jgi:hypothetical protein